MGQSIGRPADRTRSRKSRDVVVMAALALLLAFAVIGLVSAGIFMGGKLSGGSAAKVPPPTTAALHPGSISKSVSIAKADATAIVSAANTASRAIVKAATDSANKKARLILAQAHRHAAAVAARSAALSGSTAPSVPAAANAVSAGAVAAAVPTAPLPSAVATVGVAARTGNGAAAAVPNLRGVPSSWLVVAYNATFGAGPGTAGSVSVINRSGKPFSGTARVVYTHGGSASASFNGIAAGQSVTLPLNGPAYSGGGYRLQIVNIH